MIKEQKKKRLFRLEGSLTRKTFRQIKKNYKNGISFPATPKVKVQRFRFSCAEVAKIAMRSKVQLRDGARCCRLTFSFFSFFFLPVLASSLLFCPQIEAKCQSVYEGGRRSHDSHLNLVLKRFDLDRDVDDFLQESLLIQRRPTNEGEA